jgi:ankyrin repeat protein
MNFRLLAACRRADRATATALLAADPHLPGRLTVSDYQALAGAADHGATEAVRLMLDLGFPASIRSAQDDGATALHLAAGAGSAATVRLLLERGANIEARDTTYNGTPLEWAIVGSGLRLGHDPHPDWPATVSALLDAGAATDAITLSPDDPKPPSAEVAALLRARGIPEQGAGSTSG